MASRLTRGLFIPLLFISFSLSAQTWIGGGTDWNDPANWSSNPSLPSNGATITIDGLIATVDVPSSFAPGQIDIINGGELIINSTLDVTFDTYTNLTGTGSRLTVNSGGLFTAEFISATDNASIKITGGELDVADQLSMSDGTFDITGGLLDYNGSVGEELVIINSDFTMTAGLLEFNRGIVVTGGTFSLEEGGTMTATATNRNLEFKGDVVADLDGTINNMDGDLSLYGTSVVNLLANLTMTLDDLVMNDDGQSSTLNVYGDLTAFDDLKFDENPPDHTTGDNDQIIVKDGGNLDIKGTFRDLADLEGGNIHAESGATVHIEQLSDGLTADDVYGTLLTSETGSHMTVGDDPPLPVDLISFVAEIFDEKIHLTWVTASEVNNNYFELLRSSDGINFKELARIEGNGNSNKSIEYNFQDQVLRTGTYYYQLKQVDFDGQHEYHEIIHIGFTKTTDAKIIVSPNPITQEQIAIHTSNKLLQPAVSIYSLSGKVVYYKLLPSNNKWVLEKSEINLVKGAYILEIHDLATGQSLNSTKISIRN